MSVGKSALSENKQYYSHTELQNKKTVEIINYLYRNELYNVYRIK